jgi:hypothetical protein
MGQFIEVPSTETALDSNDTLYGDAGDDVISTSGGSAYLDGGTGSDTITGGSENDTIVGGTGDDAIYGGTGADSISAGDDADTIFLEDNFGNDTIFGGEGGTDFDTINLSAIIVPLTITFTGDEQGTITDGTHTITFYQIEAFALPNGETVSSGTSGDVIYVGDTNANGAGGGAGDDTLSGGTAMTAWGGATAMT